MKLIFNNGMNIIGQGAKIILFTLPAAVAAFILHVKIPGIVRIPFPINLQVVLGYILLISGVMLWLPAVIQLLIGFPQGKLVTTGAYGVCRNPIYTSFGLFIIPGVAFLTATWSYFIVSVFLLLGVFTFIRKEEMKLLEVFGTEYKKYCASVSRIAPFIKPAATK